MKFSAKEIVDIAVGIEESGYYFYTRCREKFDNREFKELFGFLAEEELRHKEIFEKMLGELKDLSGMFTEEYFQYLRAIGDERVFKNNGDVDRVIKGIASINDVLKVALTAEKDSILWYSELAVMYGKDRDTHLVLERLLDEERRHVVLLLEIKEKLSL